MSKKFEIIHQRQPTDHTCNQTCLAMLLGVPVADVIRVFGDGGFSTEDLHAALNRCRFWWDGMLFGNLIAHGHYIASVPSLNFPGGGHVVIIRKDERSETVFDPQRGNPDRKFYGEPADGGISVRWKAELVYVCKNGWGSNWYDGLLPAPRAELQPV